MSTDGTHNDVARIAVAGAPVSFGVFELAPEEGVELAGPETICAVLEQTGYVGVDMGPVGFLGRNAELRDRLHRHDLELAGGWVDLPFIDGIDNNADAFEAAFAQLDATLDVFVEAAEGHPSRMPLPTLACSGSAIRKANPGGGAEFTLTDEQWGPYAERVMQAVQKVRSRGLEPTFHHHACTYVETPDEIDQLLARTDVGLTFDTGHLLLGGGDPLTGWRRWQERINHLHLKDARVSVLDAVVKGKGDMRAVWAGRAFVPFGHGDLDLAGIMNEVMASDFTGWLIVEQDTIPRIDDDPEAIVRDHRTNREALRTWL